MKYKRYNKERVIEKIQAGVSESEIVAKENISVSALRMIRHRLKHGHWYNQLPPLERTIRMLERGKPELYVRQTMGDALTDEAKTWL